MMQQEFCCVNIIDKLENMENETNPISPIHMHLEAIIAGRQEALESVNSQQEAAT